MKGASKPLSACVAFEYMAMKACDQLYYVRDKIQASAWRCPSRLMVHAGVAAR